MLTSEPTAISLEKHRQALEASIAEWEKKRDAENPFFVSTGNTVCPLCILHTYRYRVGCENCVIGKRTKTTNCLNTPYRHAAMNRIKWQGVYRSVYSSCEENAEAKQAWQKAAQAEIDFLKSLRADLE